MTLSCYPRVNGLRLIDGICVCMRVLRRKRYRCLRDCNARQRVCALQVYAGTCI